MIENTDVMSQVADATVLDLGAAVAVQCPDCGKYSSTIMVGVGPVIHEPDDMQMVGTFGYQHCGHILICGHLAERCQAILHCLEILDGRVDADLLYAVTLTDHLDN